MLDIAATLLDAVRHREAGRRAESVSLCDAVLAADPEQPRALFLSGVLMLEEGRAHAAAATLARAVARDPTHRRARINLLRALLATGRHDQVLRAAEAALTCFPDEAELHFARGTALGALKRPEEAVASLSRAVALDPSHASAWLNLGNACADLDRLEDAEANILAALDATLALPEAWASLGFVLTSRGRLQEARAACEAAIAQSPDFAQAHWNLATAALLAGDYTVGFAEYEWRKRHDRYRRDFIDLPGRVWNGEDVGGLDVLIQAEQGLGDTIQLSRYIPLLAARGARVKLACAASLIPLLRRSPGLSAAVDRTGRLPDHDFWIDQMSLPRVFATTPETIPHAAGWLVADPPPDFVLTLPRPRVGIVWAGNPAHSNDRRRSLPQEAVLRLARAAPRSLISLQCGPRAHEAATYEFHDLSTDLTDFAVTASVVAGLDLVVCVDTSVAHLAGALGVPCWVMLPYAPDWRWLLGRDETPWYASLRLFRQQRPGDWAPVIARVAKALEGYAAPA